MDVLEVVDEAERLYGELGASGLQVVLDDREESAGVKFADADLIGYPLQVVVGKRGIQAGKVDLKVRATGARTEAPLDGAARSAKDLLGAAP